MTTTATYTYDPTDISTFALNRMRFELGDTQVAGGGDTCALCDEEYLALIGSDWRQARIACLRAIVARFAMSADYSADGVSIALSGRFERWKSMLDRELAVASTIRYGGIDHAE